MIWGANGEARDKAVFLFKKDLCGPDDYAFDWSAKDNLTGDGVEGHLVVGFVLIEVVLGWCCGGGFVVLS